MYNTVYDNYILPVQIEEGGDCIRKTRVENELFDRQVAQGSREGQTMLLLLMTQRRLLLPGPASPSSTAPPLMFLSPVGVVGGSKE